MKKIIHLSLILYAVNLLILRAENTASDAITHALKIKDIPIHSKFLDELKDIRGPQEIIEGEYVCWDYAFQWSALGPNGEKLILKKGTPMRFVSATRNGCEVSINGTTYSITAPPHNGMKFSLADMKIKGLEESIVKNRLGDPQQIRDQDGLKVYFYSKEYTITRQGFDYVSSNTSGTLYGNEQIPNNNIRYESTTQTRVPYTESKTYKPYSFLIRFDSDGKATHVDDLYTDSSWVRK